MNHWLGMALVSVVLLLWLAFTRWLGKRGLRAETVRKLYHSGSGALLLSLPLLCGQDVVPVLTWGVVSALAIGVLLHNPDLRGRVGGAVYDVSRISYGDIYFVTGVVLLFFLSAPTYYTYAVPLTMLAFADAVSALIGKRFGKHKFEAVEGRKSIEGSLAFFTVAFLAAVAWSPVLPNANLLQVTVIGVILGLVVMLLEAISWRGLDNLLIPLGGFLLLHTYLMMDLQRLVLNLTVITLLVAFVIGWRRRTTLNDSALITGALFGYTAWTAASGLWDHTSRLIGWGWLAPPLLLFLLFNIFTAPRLMDERHKPHNVDAVFGAVFAGALWLYIAFYFNRPDLAFPYCVSFACVSINMHFERLRDWHIPGLLREGRGMLLGGMVMLGIALGQLWLLGYGDQPGLLLRLLLWGALGIAVALLTRWLLDKPLSKEQHIHWRWHIRAAAATVGSLVAALPLLHLQFLPQ